MLENTKTMEFMRLLEMNSALKAHRKKRLNESYSDYSLRSRRISVSIFNKGLNIGRNAGRFKHGNKGGYHIFQWPHPYLEQE